MRNSFTDTFVKNLDQAGRYTDGSTTGLNLQVKQGGGKYWTYRYLFQGKRCDFSLGSYPSVSLKEARARAVNARSQVLQGQQPAASWRPVQPKPVEVNDMPVKTTFADYAAACIESKRSEWRNPKHAEQWVSTIKEYANPVIGGKNLDDIDTDDILKILNPIWHTKTVTASRLRGRIEWVLASATTRKLRSGHNPAAWRGHLETILPKPNKIKNEQHHKALDYKSIPDFIKRLKDMDGIAAIALEFLILNANRTGEVIAAKREEINLTNLWVIPAERMKAKQEHRVPLCNRSIELLQIAQSFDPDSDYLFSKNGRPLSNMAMSMLLRRMGHDETVHGFRSSFRDWVAEETHYSPEIAEKALAHAIANKVESAYRRGDLIEHRKRLMADWESYCQNGQWGNVIVLEKKLLKL
jgi:integrase